MHIKRAACIVQVLAIQPVMDKRASMTLEFLLETQCRFSQPRHRCFLLTFYIFVTAQLPFCSSVRLLAVQTKLWGFC